MSPIYVLIVGLMCFQTEVTAADVLGASEMECILRLATAALCLSNFLPDKRMARESNYLQTL